MCHPEGRQEEVVFAGSGKTKRKLVAVLIGPFLEFYSAFGNKTSRGTAAEAYKNVPWTKDSGANKDLAAKILEAAKQMPAKHAKSKASGSTPIMPSTWLNQMRWEDQGITTPPTPVSERPKPAPHNWEEAMLKHFTDEGMVTALARYNTNTGFRTWDSLDLPTKAEVRKIAQTIENTAHA